MFFFTTFFFIVGSPLGGGRGRGRVAAAARAGGGYSCLWPGKRRAERAERARRRAGTNRAKNTGEAKRETGPMAAE